MKTALKEFHLSSMMAGLMNDPTNLCVNVDILGRSEHIDVLLQSFRKITEGRASHFVTVRGRSGTGKSRVVETFGDGIKSKALYCSGKCESTRTNEPFWVLKDALRELCKVLTTDKVWKDSLDVTVKDVRGALGTEGSVLSEIVPELAPLVGKTSTSNKTEELSFAQDRLKYLFCTLIESLNENIPVVMFCDDIQWIDASSLEILSWLAVNRRIKSFLLIAAYRDNEFTDDHPVAQELRLIEGKKAEGTISHLTVKNMSLMEVNYLVARILKRDTVDVKELSEVVYEKTHGNVFHVLQLLQALKTEGLLNFSIMGMKWTWVDVERIRFHTDLGDNVVSLIANKLKKLDSNVRRCLMVASCLSSTINPTLLHTLSTRLDKGLNFDVDSAIERATLEGLLLSDRNATVEVKLYRFAHDRIQQAAHSLIPEGSELDKLHFDIGNVLLEAKDRLPGEEQSIIVFLGPNQLQLGIARITTEADFVRLAKLHREAGETAMSMAAFASAMDYFEKGIEAMENVPDAWSKHHELKMALYQSLADVSWSCGSPTRSETLVKKTIIPNTTCLEQKLQANHTLAMSLGSQSRLQEAMEVGINQLTEMGVLPRSLRAIRTISVLLQLKKRVRKLTIQDVVNLPICTNKIANSSMEWLRTLAKHASYRGDKILQVLVCSIMMKSVLKHGVHEEIFMCFTSLGVFITLLFGDAEEGCRLGEMASALMKRFGNTDMLSLVAIWSMLNPWRQPLTLVLRPLLEGFKVGMKQGSVETACLCFSNYLYIAYLAGLNLGPLLEDAQSHTETLEHHGIQTVLGILMPLRQAMMNLSGHGKDPKLLKGEAMDENRFKKEFRHNSLALYSLHTHKMVIYYYFGDVAKADESLKMAKKVGSTAVFFGDVVQMLVFEALIPLALATQTGRPIYKVRARRAIRVVRKAVTKEHKGMNIAHRLQLLEAGLLAMDASLAKQGDVKTAFDSAISQAARCGYRQDAALANWHAGEFFRKGRDPDWASFYISRAIGLFDDWGARGMKNYMASLYAGELDIRSEKQLSSNHQGRSRHNAMTANLYKTVSSKLSETGSLHIVTTPDE